MKQQIETRRIGGVTRNVIELTGNLAMSPAEVIRSARQNKARASFLTGRTLAGLPLAGAVGSYYDAVIAGYSDAENLKKRQELLAAVAANPKDGALRKQMAGIRIETFSNYLLAPALWLGAFADVVNLKADETPYAQRITKQEISVYGVGGDGSPRMVKINLDPDETRIPLGYITTDIVRYRKVDPYKGAIVDPALATIKLAYDMGNRLNYQVQNLLIGEGAEFFGAFVFTGKKANWTYVANSYINTANLPESNDVTVLEQDGVTHTSKFGFQVLAAVVDYCSRWKGAFEDGVDLRPTGKIVLPPAHIKEIASGIYPSGATRNDIADELMELGWFSVNYLGVNWIFEPDTTLDPDNRVCYPVFNKKAVTTYFKPELDEEKDSSGDYDIDSKNEEERYMRRIFGAYYDTTRRPYLARFNYAG